MSMASRIRCNRKVTPKELVARFGQVHDVSARKAKAKPFEDPVRALVEVAARRVHDAFCIDVRAKTDWPDGTLFVVLRGLCPDLVAFLAMLLVEVKPVDETLEKYLAESQTQGYSRRLPVIATNILVWVLLIDGKPIDVFELGKAKATKIPRNADLSAYLDLNRADDLTAWIENIVRTHTHLVDTQGALHAFATVIRHIREYARDRLCLGGDATAVLAVCKMLGNTDGPRREEGGILETLGVDRLVYDEDMQIDRPETLDLAAQQCSQLLGLQQALRWMDNPAVYSWQASWDTDGDLIREMYKISVVDGALLSPEVRSSLDLLQSILRRSLPEKLVPDLDEFVRDILRISDPEQARAEGVVGRQDAIDRAMARLARRRVFVDGKLDEEIHINLLCCGPGALLLNLVDVLAGADEGASEQVVDQRARKILPRVVAVESQIAVWMSALHAARRLARRHGADGPRVLLGDVRGPGTLSSAEKSALARHPRLDEIARRAADTAYAVLAQPKRSVIIATPPVNREDSPLVQDLLDRPSEATIIMVPDTILHSPENLAIRWRILSSRERIVAVMLGGSRKENVRASIDANLLGNDSKQGMVILAMFGRRSFGTAETEVLYLSGTEEDKLETLAVLNDEKSLREREAAGKVRRSTVSPRKSLRWNIAPFGSSTDIYCSWPRLDEIFDGAGTGIKTDADDKVIDRSPWCEDDGRPPFHDVPLELDSIDLDVLAELKPSQVGLVEDMIEKPRVRLGVAAHNRFREYCGVQVIRYPANHHCVEQHVQLYEAERPSIVGTELVARVRHPASRLYRYVAGILHSSEFGAEFLHEIRGGLRVIPPRTPDDFDEGDAIGSRLVEVFDLRIPLQAVEIPEDAMRLLAPMPASSVENLVVSGPAIEETGAVDPCVGDLVKVRLNDDLVVPRVPRISIAFQVGGFYPVMKWIARRRKQTLDYDRDLPAFCDLIRRAAVLALLQHRSNALYRNLRG